MRRGREHREQAVRHLVRAGVAVEQRVHRLLARAEPAPRGRRLLPSLSRGSRGRGGVGQEGAHDHIAQCGGGVGQCGQQGGALRALRQGGGGGAQGGDGGAVGGGADAGRDRVQPGAVGRLAMSVKDDIRVKMLEETWGRGPITEREGRETGARATTETA